MDEMQGTAYASRDVYASESVASETRLSRSGASLSRRWIPGEFGIWAFVIADMLVFGYIFIVFAYGYAKNPEVFAAGGDILSLASGSFNTFFLLTASLFVAMAVQRVRESRTYAGRNLLVGAAICGIAFIVNKWFEWGAKIESGRTPVGDHFFQLYYLLTGFHLLHVVVAMVVLACMVRLTRQVESIPTHPQLRFLENGASYWHLVDALWLVLFALFYLV